MNLEQEPAVREQPRRRFLRFSLKMLFVFVTLFCVWLGTFANSANRQKRAVEAIERSGGQFLYDYQRVPTPKRLGRGQRFSHRMHPPGPNWLRRVLGDHYFISPLALTIGRQNGIKDNCFVRLDALTSLETVMLYEVPLRDSDIKHLKRLRNLQSLTFNEGVLSGTNSPTRFEFLSELTKLESLSLVDSKFGDRDARFLGDTVNLNTLFLYRSAIGDDGLAYFQNLKNLQMLGLSGTKVTDRGMAYIRNLPKLLYLALSDTEVSDRSIEVLTAMDSLRDVELYRTKVTQDGIRRLREAMPQCKINGKGGDGTSVADDPFSL
jgi:hypothetical protein